MHAQRIGAPADRVPDAPTVVVRHMLALQAQDLPHALWAIGIRATGTTRDAVRAAFDRGDVVRSWPMRGTLHAVRPDDLRMLLGLTADRTLRQTRRRREQLGLDDAVVDRARLRVVEVLERDGTRARDALLADLRAVGIDTAAGRGTHLLLHLAVEGLIAWGPTADRGQSVVLLDAWSPAREDPPDREESLRRALVGHLRGRGPATLDDVAKWLGLPLGDVRTARAAAGEAVTDDGDGRWALTEDLDAVPSSVPSAHLLPGFDEYLLGYADRSAQLDRALEHHVVPGGNGIFAPMVVVRGRVVGTWRRTGEVVLVTPFSTLTPSAVTSVRTAAGRYGAFLGSAVAVEVTDPVTA